jgi:hypothetical protein
VLLLQKNLSPSQGAFTGHDAAYVGPDLHSILIDPSSPGRIFVGGHASAAVSADGGRTLQQVTGLENVDAMNWLSSPDGQHQVVAGHYGVRTSGDDGRTWQDISGVLPRTDVHAAGMDPGAPSHLWAYVVGIGVVASTDSGQAWGIVGGQDLSLMGPMIVTAGGKQIVAADVQAGIVRSVDGGRTWSPTDSAVQAFWMNVDPADSNHLLAVGRLLYESKDGGSSWAPVAPLPDGVRAVAIAPGATPSWYAGRWANEDASLLVSTDHGQHWQAVASGP